MLELCFKNCWILRMFCVSIPTLKIRSKLGHVFCVLCLYTHFKDQIKTGLCNNLNGKRIWKIKYVCVCITESLCCTYETFATLLMSYMPIWSSPVAQLVKNLLALVGDARAASLIHGLGRSPGDINGNPLQCSGPGRFYGQRGLLDHSPWGHKELDTVEPTCTHTHISIK